MSLIRVANDWIYLMEWWLYGRERCEMFDSHFEFYVFLWLWVCACANAYNRPNIFHFILFYFHQRETLNDYNSTLTSNSHDIPTDIFTHTLFPFIDFFSSKQQQIKMNNKKTRKNGKNENNTSEEWKLFSFLFNLLAVNWLIHFDWISCCFGVHLFIRRFNLI